MKSKKEAIEKIKMEALRNPNHKYAHYLLHGTISECKEFFDLLLNIFNEKIPIIKRYDRSKLCIILKNSTEIHVLNRIQYLEGRKWNGIHFHISSILKYHTEGSDKFMIVS